jgi:iron complex outermembrane receptor protein
LGARYRVAVGEAQVIPSAGVRYYSHSRFASRAAPHAGLAYRSRHLTAFGSYARGVSYPGVYTIGVASETLEGLEAEVLDHSEAGLSVVWHPWIAASVSVFLDRADNLLQWTREGLVNVREYETTGMEVSVGSDIHQSLSIYGSVTLLNPKYEKTPRVPRVSVSGGANWRPLKRLRISLDTEYVDEQYVFNGRSGQMVVQGAEKIESYLVSNGSVGYSISEWVPGGCEVSLSVDNLTNEGYEFQPGYPMPGRNISMAARLSF